MIITLDLNSSSMSNNNGIYTETLVNMPVGKRVKIISVISMVSVTSATYGYFIYLISNLIQNNSYDSLTNGTSNILQLIEAINGTVFGAETAYYTDSNMYQIETILPETITIQKAYNIARTKFDNGSFHIRICMETIDD
jgi:hypothetical protein